MIEKHFILDNKIKSPDNEFSMNKNAFEKYVKAIRETEIILGKEKIDKKKILKGRLKTITRSLFYMKDLKKGDLLNKDNVRSFRPGIGVRPNLLNVFIGKKLKQNVKKFSPLKEKHI